MPFRAKPDTTPPLLDWTGGIKSELLDYAGKRRFHRAYEQAFLAQFGDLMESTLYDPRGNPLETELVDESGDPLGVAGISESEFGNFLDTFMLEHRLPDGKTIVAHFVANRPELTEAQRALLLSWQNVVEGLFEIERNEGESLRLHNLVDDLPYHAYANAGARAIKGMKRGYFLGARLVPFGDDWLLSGYQQLLEPAARKEVCLTAMSLGITNPGLVFRNPGLLEQGKDLQRRDRDAFVAYFGSDLVVVPGSELNDTYRAFREYQYRAARGEDGKTAAERTAGPGQEAPELPDFGLDDEFGDEASVGVIYDEVDGLNFFPDFQLVEELFIDPALLADRRHRKALLDYLESPEIIPLPLVRLAERDPARTDRVFAKLLKRSHFDWNRDGATLLQKFKADYYKAPIYPTTVPVPERVAQVIEGGR